MTDVIEIIHPSTGNYNLFILGTGTGEYDLEFVIYDHEGRRSYKIVKSVKITKDGIHKYHFEYNDDLSRQLKVDFSPIPESARER
jgi:hypothetical protein